MSVEIFFVPGGLYRVRATAGIHLYRSSDWKVGVWINDTFMVIDFVDRHNENIEYGFCTFVLSTWGTGFLHPTAYSKVERLA